MGFLKRYIKHLNTRHIPPQHGQVWDQGGTLLSLKIFPNSTRIFIIAGNASWSDSYEDWRNRVYNRRLFLVKPGTGLKYGGAPCLS